MATSMGSTSEGKVDHTKVIVFTLLLLTGANQEYWTGRVPLEGGTLGSPQPKFHPSQNSQGYYCITYKQVHLCM